MQQLLLLLLFFPLLLHSLVVEHVCNIEQMVENKKLGYFVGSFDPLHKGHERSAQYLVDQGLADYVLIYPVWGGDMYKVRTPVDARLDMLFQAFENHPSILVTRLPPKELQQLLLPLLKKTTCIGIVGSDTALYLNPNPDTSIYYMTGLEIEPQYATHTWGSCMALKVDSFIVFVRNQDDCSVLQGHIRERPITQFVTLAEVKDISSTEVKERLKRGRSIKEHLSEPILDWINSKNFYIRN